MDNENVIEAQDVCVEFGGGQAKVNALIDFGISLKKGTILGLVGESGSGKSVSARAMMQLVTKPGKVTGGSVYVRSDKINGGQPADVLSMKPDSAEVRRVRGNVISMIFQEPMSALSMVHTIGQHMYRPVEIHLGLKGKENRAHCIKVLESVKMPGADERIDSYPFQLSGGLRQRAMIAIALCCDPDILIADEPTTALDVTIQAQVLNLIQQIRDDREMSVIFITHDLGVVAEICDEVAVMYLGEIVERGTVFDIFRDPLHPYTQALLRSIPRLGEGRSQKLKPISGALPDPFNRPTGCPFHPRCDMAIPGTCDRVAPRVTTTPDGRTVRCVLHEDRT